MVSSKDMSNFLRSICPDNIGFLDKIKVIYRPYICPLDIVLSLIPPQSAVFDIGCGAGQLLFLINNFCNPTRLYGIDVSKSSVDNCNYIASQSAISNIVASVYDGQNIPESISEYNVITLVDVLHHIPKHLQYEYIKKLYETIKTGDLLIIKDIDRDSKLVFVNKLHDLVLSKQISNELIADDLKKFLGELGATITYFKKITTLYPHYVIVVQK